MMKPSIFIRQFHRWTSVIFPALVVFVFVASTLPAPPEWVFYTPLLALELMLLSGLYLFGLPYIRCGKT